MTRQVGIDQEDLCLNGDTATDSSDPDYDFLKLNDGWVKQIATGGHVVDHASAGMSLDVFHAAGGQRIGGLADDTTRGNRHYIFLLCRFSASLLTEGRAGSAARSW